MILRWLWKNPPQVQSQIWYGINEKKQKLFNRAEMLRNLVLSQVWGNEHALHNSNSWYAWNDYEKVLSPITTDKVLGLMKPTDRSAYPLPFEYRVAFKDRSISEREVEKILQDIESSFEKENPISIVNKLKSSNFPSDRLFTNSP